VAQVDEKRGANEDKEHGDGEGGGEAGSDRQAAH
jgi:hypothetical protein